MSSPIPPIQAPEEVTGAQAVQAADAGQPTAATTGVSAAEGPSVYVDTFPGSPPPEVLAQMAAAGQTYESLRAEGKEVRFSTDEHSGHTQIEVRDRRGETIKTLSVPEAVDLATGEPPA